MKINIEKPYKSFNLQWNCMVLNSNKNSLKNPSNPLVGFYVNVYACVCQIKLFNI